VAGQNNLHVLFEGQRAVLVNVQGMRMRPEMFPWLREGEIVSAPFATFISARHTNVMGYKATCTYNLSTVMLDLTKHGLH